MPKAQNHAASRKRRQRTLRNAKGYFGNASRLYRYAKQATDRAGQFAYRDRRNRKRDFRRLWIVRINAGARLNGLSYNRFMHGLQKAGCELNRKMLADLAARDPEGFAELAKVAKTALGMDAAAAAAPSAEVEPEAPKKAAKKTAKKPAKKTAKKTAKKPAKKKTKESKKK